MKSDIETSHLLERVRALIARERARKKTIQEIADICDVSPRVIQKWCEPDRVTGDALTLERAASAMSSADG